MYKLITLLVASLALVTVSVANDTDPTIRGGGDRVRLEARLSGSTLASGKAKYEERTRGTQLQQRFKVNVEDATPGESLPIFVNGAMFGTVVVNNLGRAELQFRTATFIDDPGDGTPIGDGFPHLQPGDVVSVGEILTGTLAGR